MVYRNDLPHDELIHWFQYVHLPMEYVAIVMLTGVLILSRIYRVYNEFPGSLFEWILALDIAHALLGGPLRWTPNSSVLRNLGDVYTATPGGCFFVAATDTFFQMASLYTNTAIISVVFYMVFFTSSLRGDVGKKVKRYLIAGFWLFCLIPALAVGSSQPYRGNGWCSPDKLILVYKIVIWNGALVLQIAMVVPTQYKIYQSSLASLKSVSKGTYLRFCGIVVIQVIGLAPMMAVEFLGLNREMVWSGVTKFLIVGLPLAHMLDAILMSVKVLPLLSPPLQRLLSRLEKTDSPGTDASTKQDDSQSSKGSKADGPNKGTKSPKSLKSRGSKGPRRGRKFIGRIAQMIRRRGGESSKDIELPKNEPKKSSLEPSGEGNPPRSPVRTPRDGGRESYRASQRESRLNTKGSRMSTLDTGGSSFQGPPSAEPGVAMSYGSLPPGPASYGDVKPSLTTTTTTATTDGTRSPPRQVRPKRPRQEEVMRSDRLDRLQRDGRCGVASKVAWALAVPMLALFVLLGYWIYEASQQINAANAVLRNIGITQPMANVLTAVEQESASIPIYMASDHSQFGTILQTLINETDQARDQFQTFVSMQSLELVRTEEFQQALCGLRSLTDQRPQLLTLSASTDEALAVYQEITAQFLVALKYVVTSESSTSSRLITYGLLSGLQYALDDQRAMVMRILSAPAFTSDLYRAFMHSAGTLDVYREAFTVFAPSNVAASFTTALQQLDAYRQTVENAILGGDVNLALLDPKSTNELYGSLSNNLRVAMMGAVVQGTKEKAKSQRVLGEMIMSINVFMLSMFVSFVLGSMFVALTSVRSFMLDFQHFQRRFGNGDVAPIKRSRFEFINWIRTRKVALTTQVFWTIVPPVVGVVAVSSYQIPSLVSSTQQGVRVWSNLGNCATLERFVEAIEWEKVAAMGFLVPQLQSNYTWDDRVAYTTLWSENLSVMQQQWDTADPGSYGTLFGLLVSVSQLPAARAAFVASPSWDGLLQYDIIRSQCVDVVRALSKEATDGPYDQSLLAYISLFYAKYNLGYQRGAGAVAFGDGTFQSQEYNQYIRSREVQAGWEDIFQSSGNTQDINAYQGLQQTPVFLGVARWDTLLSSNDSSEIGMSRAGEWYMLASDKADHISTLLNQLNSGLNSLAVDLMSTSQGVLQGYSAVIFWVGVLCFAGVLRIFMRIQNFRRLLVNYLKQEETRVGGKESDPAKKPALDKSSIDAVYTAAPSVNKDGGDDSDGDRATLLATTEASSHPQQEQAHPPKPRHSSLPTTHPHHFANFLHLFWALGLSKRDSSQHRSEMLGFYAFLCSPAGFPSIEEWAQEREKTDRTFVASFWKELSNLHSEAAHLREGVDHSTGDGAEQVNRLYAHAELVYRTYFDEKHDLLARASTYRARAYSSITLSTTRSSDTQLRSSSPLPRFSTMTESSGYSSGPARPAGKKSKHVQQASRSQSSSNRPQLREAAPRGGHNGAGSKAGHSKNQSSVSGWRKFIPQRDATSTVSGNSHHNHTSTRGGSRRQFAASSKGSNSLLTVPAMSNQPIAPEYSQLASLSLKEILDTPERSAQLWDYARDHQCLELAEFTEDVHALVKHVTAEQQNRQSQENYVLPLQNLVAEAQAIYDKFLVRGASSEINVSFDAQERVRSRLTMMNSNSDSSSSSSSSSGSSSSSSSSNGNSADTTLAELLILYDECIKLVERMLRQNWVMTVAVSS